MDASVAAAMAVNVQPRPSISRTLSFHVVMDAKPTASHRPCQRAPVAVPREAMPMTVGARIVQARKNKGLTRPQLAEAAGVPYPTLAGLENGDQKTSTALPAIAAVCGVSALWLATGKGSKGAEAAPASQPERIDPAMMVTAQRWVEYEEGLGARFSPEKRAYRLGEVLNLLLAHGGELMGEPAYQFMHEAKITYGGSIEQKERPGRRKRA